MRGTNLKKHAMLMLVVLGGLAMLGFKSTKLAFTWKNPEFNGGPFKNVMVLAINGRASARADYEDRLVAAITRPGLQAVPSYSLLPRPEATPIDMNQLRDVVQGQGFDAVIASRLVKYDKTVTYVPGQAYPLYPAYATFYGYYAFVSPIVYTPGYLQTDTQAQVETNFYSTSKPEGVLVWTGTTNTVNPKSVDKAIDAIVKMVVGGLEKDSII
jgi:hypothetical protein